MKSVFKRMAGVILAAALGACGGGGSDVSGGGNNPLPPSKAWGIAALIETDNLGDTEEPKIASDANGNAVAVWAQSDGTRYNIWANRMTSAGVWGTAQLIENTNTGHAFKPQITMHANGNAVAVWEQSDGMRNNIWANRMTSAGVWGTAQLIETDNVGSAVEPQIAVDASGNVVAVWTQNDGARFNIWANRMTSAGVWGTAQLIETDNMGSAVEPQIAIDANGNAVAVWEQSDGTRSNIWANRMTPAGIWGTAALIETDNAGSAFNPEIAIDTVGNAVAVWNQSDGTRNNIWANRMTSAGVWGAAQLIETDNVGNAYIPEIAIDANGNAVVVWEQFDGNQYNVWANRMTSTGVWGTAQLIETDNAANAENPQIAIDANGNAVAVWYQFDGTRDNIWANSLR